MCAHILSTVLIPVSVGHKFRGNGQPLREFCPQEN